MQPPMGLSSELLWVLLLAVLGAIALIVRWYLSDINSKVDSLRFNLESTKIHSEKIDTKLTDFIDHNRELRDIQAEMHRENVENMKELQRTVMALINVRGAGH